MPPQPQQDQSPCHDALVSENEDTSLEPTLHDLQSQAAVEGWNKLRGQMLLTAIEMSAMPEGQTCLCCSEKATLRCQKCGPLVHYCYQCYLKQHERANFFHVPEKWEVIPIERSISSNWARAWDSSPIVGKPGFHVPSAQSSKALLM